MKIRRTRGRINFVQKPTFGWRKIVGGFTKYCLWISIVIFVVVQIFITIQTSTAGAKLVNLEEEEKKLQLTNRELSEELVKNTSLTDIGTYASELEFKQPSQVLYINSNDFVAKVP